MFNVVREELHRGEKVVVEMFHETDVGYSIFVTDVVTGVSWYGASCVEGEQVRHYDSVVRLLGIP